MRTIRIAGARTRLTLLLAAVFCSDRAPTAPIVEVVALSLDSIATQLRDSASELSASLRGALGVELDAQVSWQSRNTAIVKIVPNGGADRLVPVKSGITVSSSAFELRLEAYHPTIETRIAFDENSNGGTSTISLAAAPRDRGIVFHMRSRQSIPIEGSFSVAIQP